MLTSMERQQRAKGKVSACACSMAAQAQLAGMCMRVDNSERHGRCAHAGISTTWHVYVHALIYVCIRVCTCIHDLCVRWTILNSIISTTSCRMPTMSVIQVCIACVACWCCMLQCSVTDEHDIDMYMLCRYGPGTGDRTLLCNTRTTERGEHKRAVHVHEMSCAVMGCHVVSYHVMCGDVMCHEMPCNVM